jgi:ribose 1,5-bisphosphokinase
MSDEGAAPNTAPVEEGVFIAIVGPSGGGKDTLIRYAEARFGTETAVLFARRVVTRASDQTREDHESVTFEEFDRRQRCGAFAFSWEAHGLKYGVPVSVDDAIRHGRVVVANLSRGVIPSLRARYANVAVVLVTARPETLARRLAERAGQSAEELGRRMARSADAAVAVESSLTIETEGSPEAAGERLVAILRQSIRQIRGRC